MKSHIVFACVGVLLAQSVVSGFAPQAGLRKEKVAAFSFADIIYFHRFTQGNQHEYTPDGQEDLKAWTDMVTILLYPAARDGEALAATANGVLENYKAHEGVIVRTDSVPRTRDRAAEYLMVVVFGRPEFVEVAFSRFRMHEGVGSVVVYSHRIYGNKVGDSMSAWVKQNAPATERILMKWDAMPKAPFPR